MHDENLDNPVEKPAVLDSAISKALSPSEDDTAEEKENGNGINEGDDQTPYDDTEEGINRRRHLRSVFTYPVEFKFFSQAADHASIKGFLKDISISGACLQYEDKYGRIDIKNAANGKIKISFSIPQGDKVSILALVRWIRKADPKTMSFMMGIEFQNLEPWQLEVVEKLTGMRNKDHNMMWNLWEQYENSWR